MNEIFQKREFSLSDFVGMILPQELKLASGKPILVISDFDETMCSNYIFSEAWKTHVPIINSNLNKEAQALTLPMCVATARTPNESVSWLIWHKLTKNPMPLVAENGAVLVWPQEKINSEPKLQILATNEQAQIIRQIQTDLEGGAVQKMSVPINHHIVLRTGRVATVELRAENIITKKGTPEDYAQITAQLQELFPKALDDVDIVSSGNSLGIQPKGVGKQLGIVMALTAARIKLKDVFMIGLGDNKNDEPLFNFVNTNGGITIGVRPSAKGLCDFDVDGGEAVSLAVLRLVNRTKQ